MIVAIYTLKAYDVLCKKLEHGLHVSHYMLAV